VERHVTAVDPVRVADLGGWTDTWFAGHGLVCNVAVRPGVEVHLHARPADHGGTVVVHAENFDDRYRLDEGRGRHPLLEACIDEVGVPDGLDLTITVHSEIPAGASTGTSAAVTVALVGALSALRGERLSADAAAVTAHRVEAVRLGRQSGIQDQRAAAHGGVNRITMRRYPDAEVTPVALAPPTAWALESRLLLVFLGRTHVSSDVHEAVIAGLEGATPAELAARLDPLRDAAEAGASALEAGDLRAYGEALVANNQAQASLHPDLVDAAAHRVIEVARAAGAHGWKVNGAGGAGGSLTLLAGPGAGARRHLAEEVRRADPSFVPIATTLDAGGLRVWTSTHDGRAAT
jgi:D-glycero-alpha-D-manno-heptose-7-phosphate kinase